MKRKAVLFDLDGTILDTLGDLSNSVNFALQENNLPPRSIDEVRSFVGNGIRLLIERAVPEGTDTCVVDKCFNDFKKHYKDNSAILTKPYDGVIELVKELRGKGYKTAVVSNKADFAVQSLVEQYFEDLFDFAVGEKEGVRRKPSPDSVYSVLKDMNINPDESIYIGDSEVDVETSRNAGVECVCVTWGFRDRELLEKEKPDYIADSISEILEIIGE